MNITFVWLWAHKLFRPEEPQPFGGAELQLHILATAMSQMPDVEVQFVTRGQGEYEEYQSEAIKVIKLPYHSTSLKRSIKGTYDLLRVCKTIQTDVYIQRSGGIETGVVSQAARSKKRPFVFMPSSLWDVDGTRQKKLKIPFSRLYTHGLRKADLIIAQTEEQQEALFERYGLDAYLIRSSHVIPENIPKEKQGVLWVSRCEPFKQPDTFIELAKEFSDHPFTMVCPEANSRSYFEEIQQKAAEVKNLTFLPGVSFEETEKLFASHRVFVITSEHEGYPNTFVQAFKWETPLLSLHVDPDNVINDFVLGDCVYGDQAKLKSLLKDYLEDAELWKEIQLNQRRFARDEHDLKKNVNELLGLIRGIREEELDGR